MTTTTVNNPMGELVLTDDSAGGGSYRGTYGAAKGPAAQDVTVDTGDGEELTDAVKIIDQTGTVLVTIPYRELYTFHVITGEGDRKPGISFEHKPDPESKSGTPHVRALSIRHPTPSDLADLLYTLTCCAGFQRVWMDGSSARGCAEELMGNLLELAPEEGDDDEEEES